MAEKIFQGFELLTEAQFNALSNKNKQKIYFVRTSTGETKDDGFIYFNGKKYGTGKLSSDKIQTQLTALKNKVDEHIDIKATVTANARTSGATDDNGTLSVDNKTKWLSGEAIEQIKTYVDSEDVKGMELVGTEIQLKNKTGAVLAKLDATNFIKDGMLESVTLTTGTTKGTVLRFKWNTDGKKTETDIEVSEFFHEISGDNTTITVNQPESGTGSLQISAKTVENVSGVTSGATALMTGGITQQYVTQQINTFKTGLTNTLTLDSNKVGAEDTDPYAVLTIKQTNGILTTEGSSLQVRVATGLSQDHAGFVYNSTDHSFTAKASAFNKQGLLDAQDVIALLRNNNTNIANALTYLKGQITELSGKMTTVTGSTYITVTKAEGTNNYTVSASGALDTAIKNANSAVQSVNGQKGPNVTLDTDDIKASEKISGYPSLTTTTTVTDVLNNIYSKLNTTSSNALTSVSGSTSINVTAKSNGSQTISVNAKHLSETEKAAGQIEIKTDDNGIYGMLYFGGDDVEA